jgi:glycosyltransferase involved in cell wall biosynthesis
MAILPSAKDRRPRWLIDVTELAREDLGAGVERVTRRILNELILAPPEGVRIQPVRLDPRGTYVAANAFFTAFLGLADEGSARDAPILPCCGDHFIGLDFCRDYADLLEKALSQLKERGVPITLMVHDALPACEPTWFPEGVPEAFEAWLRVANACADRLLCNSQCTAKAISAVMAERGMDVSGVDMQVIPLGADFPLTPAVRAPLPARNGRIKRVLTVGTIEPRKGHAQALAAFEQLWRQGAPFEWIIAGRVGWKVEGILARIAKHPELGRRLHWVERPDDRILTSLYRDCDILLAPSYGEGYGLPVAEAGRFGLTLILRDLPVFREIAGDCAVYFSGSGHDVLMRTLLTSGEGANSNDIACRWNTWTESAAKLKEICARPLRSKSGSET